MQSDGSGSGVDILLVEDTPEDAELTLHILRQKDLAASVHHVRDGREALDYVFAEGAYAHRSIAQRPRVIFLDLKLPRVSGLEVLQAIRADKRTRAIPVVVLTSSGEQMDIATAYAIGANSYVQKPVSFADLSGAVAQLGDYWTLLNVTPPE